MLFEKMKTKREYFFCLCRLFSPAWEVSLISQANRDTKKALSDAQRIQTTFLPSFSIEEQVF